MDYLDYCQHYLNKSIDQVNRGDLENFFITEQVESNTIEFKSFIFDKNKKFQERIVDVQKEIVAFLNSDGGFLIWGAPVESRKGKPYTGQLTKVDANQDLTEDWLIRKLTDNITPLPTGVIVKVIDKEIVLIEVKKSEHSPHQSSDGIYYMRLGESSKKAPHHYIETLFKKIKYPEIEGYLKFHNKWYTTGEPRVSIFPNSALQVSIDVGLFNFSSFINEENLSFRILTANGKFFHHYTANSSNIFFNGREYRRDNIKNVFSHGEPIIDSQIIIYPNGVTEDEITLTFTGKKTPLKNSFYKIDISQALKAREASVIVIEEKLNKLYVETQKELGIAKENLIDIFKNSIR